MLGTVIKALKASDWAIALDVLSPAFFDVMPPLGMSLAMGKITRNRLDRALFSNAQNLWLRAIDRIDPQLSIAKKLPDPNVSTWNAQQRKHIGQTILKLYFSSLMAPGPSFLDLRSQRITLHGEMLYWQPNTWIFEWSPDFREAIFSVYDGFYGNKTEIFQAGLKELGLEHAEHLFLSIFGAARQEEFLFQLKEFKISFHKIFVSCRDHKKKLHPEFLPLGLMLLGFYEHASYLNVPLSAHDAWHSVAALRDPKGWNLG